MTDANFHVHACRSPFRVGAPQGRILDFSLLSTFPFCCWRDYPTFGVLPLPLQSVTNTLGPRREERLQRITESRKTKAQIFEEHHKTLCLSGSTRLHVKDLEPSRPVMSVCLQRHQQCERRGASVCPIASVREARDEATRWCRD